MYQNFTKTNGRCRFRLYHKFMLVMRLTTVILIASIMQISASTLAQKITLQKSNAPLKGIIKDLKQQSGYTFFYSESALQNAKPVTINVKNADFEQVLKMVFADQPLKYSIEEKTISIAEKEKRGFLEQVVDKIQSYVNTMEITGTILDENGRPMSGVTLRIKGAIKTIITDSKGQFLLKGAEESSIIVISYVGYKTLEIPATGYFIEVRMELAESKLDELQVTAYGKTSQRLSVGNITTVTAKDIQKSTVNNPLLALQGRVPGIKIVQSSGNANSSVIVQIQGKSRFSTASPSEPFYVVDGVPYDTRYYHGDLPGSNGPGTASGSPLTFLNMDDIESISVLKDADATAIYGSRAAFGAIIITTKKARPGKTRLDANIYQGFSNMQRRYKLLNTDQYLMMRNEAIKNDGGTVGPTNYDVNGLFWDNSRSTDWQKELFGETASNSNYNFTLSGGTGNTSYQFGTTFSRSTTIYPGDFASKSIASHLALNSSSIDQKLQFQLRLNYMNNSNKLPIGDVTLISMLLPPNAPPLLNDDGTVNWWLNDEGGPTWPLHPYASLLPNYLGKTNNLTANAQVSYELAKGLMIKGNIGFNDLNDYSVNKNPLRAIPPYELAYNLVTSSFGHGKNVSWITEPQLSYQRGFSFGEISANVGTSVQQRWGRVENVWAEGFLSEETMDDLGSATRVGGKGSAGSAYKYFGLFANINYNYGNRYLLNLSTRRDGSSRFGAKNKFANFASIGAGWAFSEEPFIKDNTGPLSFGKIKISYGLTGSDAIGDGSYLQLYSLRNNGIAYGDNVSLVSDGFTNPYLQWEENRKLNTGLDLGFFKDRVTMSLNYYRNRCSNQLLSFQLPAFTGAQSVPFNLPATVQNSGLEIIMTSRNVESEKFRWSTSFNLSANRNKLVKFDGIENTPYAYQGIVGESLNVRRVFKYAGVNPETGLHQFLGLDGQLTSSPTTGDDYVRIDPEQNVSGGIDNTISFLNFDLSFLLSWAKQRGNDVQGSPAGRQPGAPYFNMTTDVLDRWKASGNQSSVQRYNSDYSAYEAFYRFKDDSDAGWVDASYIKVKNINLSYNIPKRWQDAIKMQNATIYAQAQNLWTITGYKGLDPEGTIVSSIPPLRTIVFGVRASF